MTRSATDPRRTLERLVPVATLGKAMQMRDQNIILLALAPVAVANLGANRSQRETGNHTLALASVVLAESRYLVRGHTAC